MTTQVDLDQLLAHLPMHTALEIGKAVLPRAKEGSLTAQAVCEAVAKDLMLRWDNDFTEAQRAAGHMGLVLKVTIA